MTGSFDAIVVGAGHNGLTCAGYLARAGLKVKVVERRHVVGGAAVTEEFHPGFRNSVASYTVSLLNPKVVRELELPRYGLKVVERRASNFLPLPDGRYLLTGPGRTQSEVAKFSSRDAEALPRYERMLDAVADVLRALVLETPPNVTEAGWFAAIPELLKSAAIGRRLGSLDMELRRWVLDLFTKSAGEVLDGWFESDPIKAVLGFDSVVGTFSSPYAPGSAYVQLHHVFGEVNGKHGTWGHAIGGMGAITQAMAASARAKGADIETSAPVARILVEGGRATGVELEDGRKITAPIVASNLNPKLLFTRLVPADVLPVPFLERIGRWKLGSGSFRMNVALDRLPSFSALPNDGVGDHHTAGIVIAPSLMYMDQAWIDARASGWSREPVVEMLIASTLDDSLSPAGKHVASLFCQHFAPQLPDGSSWDLHRDTVADLVIATVERYAPGFKDSVLGRQALTPLDLERVFGLTGGDIFHGALSLDQIFSARPMLGHADYRSPVPGLYLCGSGSHPGGGVSGAPGHNAAREIVRDWRRRRLRHN